MRPYRMHITIGGLMASIGLVAVLLWFFRVSTYHGLAALWIFVLLATPGLVGDRWAKFLMPVLALAPLWLPLLFLLLFGMSVP